MHNVQRAVSPRDISCSRPNGLQSVTGIIIDQGQCTRSEQQLVAVSRATVFSVTSSKLPYSYGFSSSSVVVMFLATRFNIYTAAYIRECSKSFLEVFLTLRDLRVCSQKFWLTCCLYSSLCSSILSRLLWSFMGSLLTREWHSPASGQDVNEFQNRLQPSPAWYLEQLSPCFPGHWYYTLFRRES